MLLREGVNASGEIGTRLAEDCVFNTLDMLVLYSIKLQPLTSICTYIWLSPVISRAMLTTL